MEERDDMSHILMIVKQTSYRVILSETKTVHSTLEVLKA